MRRHLSFAAALGLDVIGAAGALLVSLQTWQTVTASRPAPFPDVTVGVTGRSLDPATTALGLVALAGVVAVLATRGRWRQAVGVLVALAGAGLVWRGATSLSAVGAGRARSLVESRRRTVSVPDSVSPDVVLHPVWPALVIVCGVLVVAAGVAVARYGAGWRALSSRYRRDTAAADAPAADAESGAADPRTAATMWNALDRGDDPTS